MEVGIEDSCWLSSARVEISTLNLLTLPSEDGCKSEIGRAYVMNDLWNKSYIIQLGGGPKDLELLRSVVELLKFFL